MRNFGLESSSDSTAHDTPWHPQAHGTLDIYAR
jgi:hypothetical protein